MVYCESERWVLRDDTPLPALVNTERLEEEARTREIRAQKRLHASWRERVADDDTKNAIQKTMDLIYRRTADLRAELGSTVASYQTGKALTELLGPENHFVVEAWEKYREERNAFFQGFKTLCDYYRDRIATKGEHHNIIVMELYAKQLLRLVHMELEASVRVGRNALILP